MKTVKFIKAYAPYAAGDIAGLEDKEARKAIEAECAVLYKKEKTEETVETAAVGEAPVDKMVKEAPKKK